MLNRLSLRRFFAALLTAMLSCACIAQDTLSATLFVEACKAHVNGTAEKGEENLCKAYLQGFFAATDKVISEEDVPSPFMRRALRTRTSGAAAASERPYCLPKNLTLDDISVKITQSDALFTAKDAADKVVETVLKAHYLCER